MFSNYKGKSAIFITCSWNYLERTCMNLFSWHSGRFKSPPYSRIILLDMCNLETNYMHFQSVQFSCSVMSNSLQPHGLQHARLPCPSPTPRAYSNSGPLSQWCHPTISSSVVPFSRLQSFPASGYFQMSRFFASGGHSIGSFSFSISPSNGIFRIDLLYDWLVGSPCSPRDCQESSPTPQFKSINSSALPFLHSPTLTSIHDHWKNHSLD